MKFQDRQEAGERLALQVAKVAQVAGIAKEKMVVVAIPRGGVVVGRVVADKLGLPLGLVVTKKVGAPGQEELAVGAMGPDGRVVLDEALVGRLGLSKMDLAPQIKNAKLKMQSYKLKFKVKEYSMADKSVVLVDDGVATGATMEAAIDWLRHKCKVQSAKCKIIVAVPVCASEAYGQLAGLADEMVCLEVPEDFGAVGQFYEHFPQVTDEEVVGILQS